MKTIKKITLATLISAALWSSNVVLAAPNQLQAIHANAVGGNTQLRLQFNQPIQIPKGFVMDNPPRIVFDFPNAEVNPTARRQTGAAGVVHSVNAANNRGQTRVVVRLNRFVDYTMELQGGNLLILDFLNAGAPQTRAPIVPMQAQAVSRPSILNAELPEVPVPDNGGYTWYNRPDMVRPPVAPAPRPRPVQVPAPRNFVPHGSTPMQSVAYNNQPRVVASQRSGTLLRGLDFRRSTDGGGRLILDLPHGNVRLDESKVGGVLTLRLRDIDIPTSLQQRMDVVDFATPIANIKTSQRDDDGIISLVGSEPFTYNILRQGTRYTVNIEKEKVDKIAAITKKKKKVFKGEKLSLNFQDIEIRAVLQLLADFTDKNIVVSDTVTGTTTLRLKDVPWDQALDVVLESKNLGMRENGNVIWIAPASEMEAKEEKEMETAKRKIELEPLITEYIPINFAKATDLATLIQKRSSEKAHSLLSDRGSVSLDERTNTLLIQDTISRVNEIKDLIKVLDVPVQQVLIESRIVTAIDEFGKELGARFGMSPRFSNKDATGMIGGSIDGASSLYNGKEVSLSDALSVNLPVTGAAGQFGFSILSPDFMLNLELSALQAESKGEIISTPRVITTNQTKAVIEQGVEVPYLQDSSSGATNVAFKKAVLSLEVTPQITPDEHISMDLKVNQDTVGAVYADVPSINTREIQTRVTVSNGQTVVLGGVHEEVRRNDMTKVPVLGDLPMVGRLFRKTDRSDEKRELLIFVTPKIIDSKQQ